ncbi:hypothetical protein V6U81_26615, partial [Micromonospora sp. CPCC 205711]|uniref:hypothetical protein n=1 Tax=Micromonospora sp. CPCC 205547 TaxID=3122400 RepID=UPI0030451BC8
MTREGGDARHRNQSEDETAFIPRVERSAPTPPARPGPTGPWLDPVLPPRRSPAADAPPARPAQ